MSKTKKRNPASWQLAGSQLQEVTDMTTPIVCNASNFASRFPCRSFQFPQSHLHPHPPLSNENIIPRRSMAVWPARSARPRPVIGLFVRGGGKLLYLGCADV